jgi:hypothetical protein
MTKHTENSERGQPLGLPLNDGLGPLPPGNEPWCFAYTSADMKAYALAEVRKAVDAERERCAKLCEPTRPRPCNCERCDCGNATDARMVAEWDEAAAMARRIRGA